MKNSMFLGFKKMQTAVLKPVPAHLTAKMTRDHNCVTDIVETNKVLDKIYGKLEIDRDFPINIDWPNGVCMNKRRQNIVKIHMENVGYIISFSQVYPTLTLALPPIDIEEKKPINPLLLFPSKKQKVTPEENPLPPSYDEFR
jgi:hypothetical protein